MMVQGLWSYQAAIGTNPKLECGFIPFPVTSRAADAKFYADVDSTIAVSAQSTPEKKAAIDAEVQGVLDAIGASHGGGKWKQMVLVDDRIADSIFQQIQTRPADYSILATLNLNGDYISDAAAAVVGGLGMAPGANIGDNAAIFEATHGTAPKYAGKDYVNPGSEILSAEMMLRHMGWTEAADLIISSMEKSILSKKVTYDFARLMDGATQVSCSGFGQVMIDHM